ncbi:hypothetical protein [Methanosarcina mazei]|nr:hypothetical protein [Methanosarcina mazei]WIM45696.1 hypothetical protein PQQ20_11935 [Methanosarcina mazei]
MKKLKAGNRFVITFLNGEGKTRKTESLLENRMKLILTTGERGR